VNGRRPGRDRGGRVAAAIREVLAELVAREVKDPRVGAAGIPSVNLVELNRDGSVAYVFVSFVGTADESTVKAGVEGMQTAAAFLRREVTRRLRLGRAPELRFRYDATAEVSEQLAEIIRADERRGE
jgi:ribosome-binding factor A